MKDESANGSGDTGNAGVARILHQPKSMGEPALAVGSQGSQCGRIDDH